ncbi:DnaD domain protein [Bacillus sp. B15-48]|uniref:DnaD domain protein n=1 Tax=Bacillus sp. B15-48 TaxID=1548601 RepID=UPI00193F740A|nr:DnaD domain protein [Bacillus sp. B15-48]MBM4762737.1 DnaD domain protein [Bacillus sp. B15-48]
MNYIKEMNAFYDWLELNELSPSAINLWYALMHINNKAGWVETFTVAESVLCVKTGLTDRTLRKVRNELKQKGRIDFTSRKGKAPIYNIISFYSTENNSELKQSSENNSADSSGVSSALRSADSSGVSSALIKHKLNETKLNKKNKEEAATLENPFAFYEQNGFGVIGGHISQKIAMWCDDLSDALVLEAMKIAVERSKVNWAYVESILRDYAQKNIKTVEQAKAAQLAFKEQQSRQKSKPRQGQVFARKESLPDWFEQQTSNQTHGTTDDSDFDFEKEKAELERELMEFKKREA